jgi:hypothetical protein
MEKNLTVKIFIIFVVTTLVVWIYSVDNISVENIVSNSIKNLYSKSISPTNESAQSAQSISSYDFTKDYYLTAKPKENTNAQSN